jgi:tRNA nucleotidyltransferase (CCA-adding enzyme)
VEQVVLLIEHLVSPDRQSATDADLRRYAATLGRENVNGAFELSYAWAIEPKARSIIEALKNRLTSLLASNPALTAKELALTGADIMRVLQIPPSPKVGEATRFLLNSVLDDPSLNSGEKLEQLLRSWASEAAK